MKSGVRALGVAESSPGGARTERARPRPGADDAGPRADDTRPHSTLAGAVVRADRIVDGLAFASCTVGGTDATDAVVDLASDLGREDVRYVCCGAVAPAWYNVLSLSAIHEATDRPVLAVTFEDSDGLDGPLREAFSGPALERRLETYRSLPPRRELRVNEETVYVRGVGLDRDEAAAVVRAFTPEGGRPEPLRMARLAARAGDAYRRETDADRRGADPNRGG